MGKRRLNYRELSRLTGGYVSFYRTIVRGVNGYAYRMDRKLSEEEKRVILSFGNTSIGTMDLYYAPELSYDGVFLGDKCF